MPSDVKVLGAKREKKGFPRGCSVADLSKDRPPTATPRRTRRRFQ